MVLDPLMFSDMIFVYVADLIVYVAYVALVSSVAISEKLFIGGDLNGHVGSTRVGFDGFMGFRVWE
jgi:hypothetical protein